LRLQRILLTLSVLPFTLLQQWMNEAAVYMANFNLIIRLVPFAAAVL
jgi:hypothetical protein